MSTPSNNFAAFSTPVAVYSGANVFPTIKAGQIRSSLRSLYYFKAYGTTGTTEFSGGDEFNIILDAVDSTESHPAYNAATGVFTVPVRGLYCFDICTDDSSNVILKVTSGGESYYPAAGGHGFSTEIALQEGDLVRLVGYDNTVGATSYPVPFSKAYLTVTNPPGTSFTGRLSFAL